MSNLASSPPVKVAVVYPSDPLGTIPGGIETFIRGIIRWSPQWLHFDVIGVTTDAATRPVAKWSDCALGDRHFRLFPVMEIAKPGTRPLLPATVRYMFHLLKCRRQFRDHYDVLDFHRAEPLFLMSSDGARKNVFFHQGRVTLRNKDAEVRWKHIPAVYDRLEDKAMRKFDSIYAVRSDVVESYREAFPDIAERITFTPTWVDTNQFFPASKEERRQLRRKLFTSRDYSDDDILIITVGRLDKSKDPILLLKAFAQVAKRDSRVQLIMVGDGILRNDINSIVHELGITDRVLLTGLVDADRVHNYLRAANIFVLSSAYEGMPMALLEGLACGLPAVSTDVGEVRRVVKNGVNGYVLESRTVEALNDALTSCVINLGGLDSDTCVASIVPFIPETVLAPIYENYRRLASATP